MKSFSLVLFTSITLTVFTCSTLVAEELSKEERQALAKRLVQTRSDLALLSQKINSQKENISRIVACRQDVLSLFAAGKIADDAILSKIDTLAPSLGRKVYSADFSTIFEKIASIVQGGTTDAYITSINSNLEFAAATTADLDKMNILEEQALWLQGQFIQDSILSAEISAELKRYGLPKPHISLTAKQSKPVIDKIQELMAGRAVAVGARGKAFYGSISGRDVALSISRYDSTARSFTGTMTYLNAGSMTKVSGWREEKRVFFREVKDLTPEVLASSGSLGSGWRLTVNEKSELVGNVRIIDENLDAGLSATTDLPWPAMEDPIESRYAYKDPSRSTSEAFFEENELAHLAITLTEPGTVQVCPRDLFAALIDSGVSYLGTARINPDPSRSYDQTDSHTVILSLCSPTPEIAARSHILRNIRSGFVPVIGLLEFTDEEEYGHRFAIRGFLSSTYLWIRLLNSQALQLEKQGVADQLHRNDDTDIIVNAFDSGNLLRSRESGRFVLKRRL